MALSRGVRLHLYLVDWLIRSQSGGSLSEHSDSGRPNQSLGWIINKKKKKSELKPTQVFFVCGLRIPSRFSPCKTHSREMAQLQDLILHLKSKRVLTARCLMSLIGLLASTEKTVPEGRLHMRPFQFHLKEHWRYPQSLDSVLPWTEAIAAHLDRWQNPSKVMKGADLHPKTTVSNSLQTPQRRLGHSFDQVLQGSVVRPGKNATHKRTKIEGGLPGPSKLQGPVPEPNSTSCNGQLNSGSLLK